MGRGGGVAREAEEILNRGPAIVTPEYVEKMKKEGWSKDLIEAGERAVRTNPRLSDEEIDVLEEAGIPRAMIRAAEEAQARPQPKPSLVARLRGKN